MIDENLFDPSGVLDRAGEDGDAVCVCVCVWDEGGEAGGVGCWADDVLDGRRRGIRGVPMLPVAEVMRMFAIILSWWEGLDVGERDGILVDELYLVELIGQTRPSTNNVYIIPTPSICRIVNEWCRSAVSFEPWGLFDGDVWGYVFIGGIQRPISDPLRPSDYGVN